MEVTQAPNIEPGTKGRLVYDKARPTIVGTQARMPDHPLAAYGHRRLPHRLWRLSPRLHGIVAALRDIWLIATGRLTLHRAWQAGYDAGHLAEVARTLNGGR